MKKGDKVSRLKERKRAREKRQRWRKREKKRLEKLMASVAMTAEVEEKIGELAEVAMRGDVAGAILVGELAVEPAPGTIIVVPKHGEVGMWARLKEFCVRVFRRGR
jgi:uncharacterized membrane protein